MRTTSDSMTRARVAGLEFDRLCEEEVVRYITESSRLGRGGWVVTPNIDICRQTRRDPAARALVESATLIVPDGMPLLWASQLSGDCLVERVTGSSLIFSLSDAAARGGQSVYLLGGEPGVPDLAGRELARRYPGLKVAGADAPPPGFEQTAGAVLAVRERLLLAAPDIVLRRPWVPEAGAAHHAADALAPQRVVRRLRGCDSHGGWRSVPCTKLDAAVWP